MMLEKNLTHQIMESVAHYPQAKKGIGLMKDQLGERIMTEFLRLKPKTYYHLIDDGTNKEMQEEQKNL